MPTRLPCTTSGASTADRSGHEGSEETSLRHHVDAVVGGAFEQAREQIAGPDLLAALAVDREHRARVGQRDRRRAGQRAQIGQRRSAVRGDQARCAGAATSRSRRAAPTACRRPPGASAARNARMPRHAATTKAASPVPSSTPSAKFISPQLEAYLCIASIDRDGVCAAGGLSRSDGRDGSEPQLPDDATRPGLPARLFDAAPEDRGASAATGSTPRTPRRRTRTATTGTRAAPTT